MGRKVGAGQIVGHQDTPKPVRQCVVQYAVYDVDIKFGFGVLRHKGTRHAGIPQEMDGMAIHLDSGTWGT